MTSRGRKPPLTPKTSASSPRSWDQRPLDPSQTTTTSPSAFSWESYQQLHPPVTTPGYRLITHNVPGTPAALITGISGTTAPQPTPPSQELRSIRSKGDENSTAALRQREQEERIERRRIQNKVAQRDFRARRDASLKSHETRLAEMNAELEQLRSGNLALAEIALTLEVDIASLQAENLVLRSQVSPLSFESLDEWPFPLRSSLGPSNGDHGAGSAAANGLR